jgi:NADPH:quinone reductase-like Zn-dependent oxidoreductase
MKLRNRILAGIGLLVVVAVAVMALVLGYTAPCEPAPALTAESTPMKAVNYRCYGSPDVLALEDVEKPAPADTEVLVRVHAAGVNPLDWHYLRGSPYVMRLGSGIGKPKVTRLGVDFAGTVEAVGAGVTRFKPGDEVFGGRTGAFGEYVVVREDRAIVGKPANVTFAEAAAVPIAGVTALQAVRDKGMVKAGHKVLINGASGGVGTFAVQLAKSYGAEVTGVCSERNVEMVRSLGADHVIDYRKDDFTAGTRRYDVIIDMVGNHPLSALRDVLVPGGIVVMVGGPPGAGGGARMSPLKALLMNPFIDEHFAFFVASMDRDDLNILARFMADGTLTPVIDRHYPLSEVSEAIAYSEEGRARGKIILDVP